MKLYIHDIILSCEGRESGRTKKESQTCFFSSNERANNMEGKVTPSYHDGLEVDDKKNLMVKTTSILVWQLQKMWVEIKSNFISLLQSILLGQKVFN